MRFFEFEIKRKEVVDVLDNFLATLPKSQLSESDSQLITDCFDFAKKYVTSPDELTVGEKYYPIVVLAQPAIGQIRLEYSNLPVEYKGVHLNKFEFVGPTKTYLIPILVEHKESSMVFSTTVFEKVIGVNHFLTMFILKFSGRAHITKSELKT